MNSHDFKTAITKIDLPLNDNQIQILFVYLDRNGDGYVDKIDWINKLGNRSK